MMDKTPFTLDDLLAEWSEDPEHVREDYRLRPYFAIAKDLLRRRKELGLTQQELAEKAETHQSRISKLEAADLDFKLSTLIAIAEAMDAHVEAQIVNNWPVSNAEFRSVIKSKRTVTSEPGPTPTIPNPVQLTFESQS